MHDSHSNPKESEMTRLQCGFAPKKMFAPKIGKLHLILIDVL